MVPSFSEDVARAMRGQPKRLSRKWRERHSMFLFRFNAEMFSVLSAVFLFGRAFVCFELVWLFNGFRKFQNGKGNEHNGSVSVRYNSLFISLPLFAKGHKTTTWNSHILHIWENVNNTRPLFEISFLKFGDVLQILFGIYRQTEWILIPARIVGWILRRCCCCCLNCFLQLGQRASAFTFDYLFVRLPSLCLGFCLSFV